MNKKRLSINFISGIIQFATSLIISFFFTPYIVSSVGEEGYGFYSIACTCISYFTVLATAMNSMASRFITIAYHNGEEEKVKSYYSTVFYSNLAISFLFSIIVLFAVANIDSLLNVPLALVADVKGMFYFVLFSGLLSSVMSVLSSTVFCMDRLDIKSISLIFISLIKVTVLYCLLTFTDIKLIYLGISYSLSIVLEGLVYVVTTIKMMPIVKLQPKLFSFSAAKELIGSGIWNSINQVNTILLNGLDLVFANVLVSASMAGVLSVAKTIPNQIMSLLLILSNIFLPSLTIAYSKKSNEEMERIFKNSFDVLGIFIGVILAGFFALGKEFFALWMSDMDSELLYHLSLMGMSSFLVIGSTQCIAQTQLLANKMKIPVLFTLARGLIGVLLIYTLSTSVEKYSVYFIAGINPLLAIIYDLFFTTPYATKCVGIKNKFIYWNKLKFLISVIILSLIFIIIKKIFVPNGLVNLVLCISVCGMVGIFFNSLFFLGKKRVIILIKNKFKKNKS